MSSEATKNSDLSFFDNENCGIEKIDIVKTKDRYVTSFAIKPSQLSIIEAVSKKMNVPKARIYELCTNIDGLRYFWHRSGLNIKDFEDLLLNNTQSDNMRAN